MNTPINGKREKMTMKYRMKHIGTEVEAIQFLDTTESICAINDLLPDRTIGVDYSGNEPILKIYPYNFGVDDEPPKPELILEPGWYLIKWDGRLACTTEKQFHEHYEPVKKLSDIWGSFEPKTYPKHGATIAVSMPLLSQILSKAFGVDIFVTGVESFGRFGAANINVLTHDDRFPAINEGERFVPVKINVKKELQYGGKGDIVGEKIVFMGVERTDEQ